MLLERIGFTKPAEKLDIHYLTKLCVAYAACVPFDTLDLFGGGGKVWNLEKIYDKIVNQRRGGFCYELFRWLLTELGYKVERLKAAHFAQETPSIVESGDHLTLMVTLDGGEKWLTDVGWGGAAFRLPLNLNLLGEEQRQPYGTYRIEKHEQVYELQKKKQASPKTEDHDTASSGNKEDPCWNTIYRFQMQPCGFDDFEDDFATQCSGPAFTSAPIATLQINATKKVLYGYRYAEKQWISLGTTKLIRDKRCTKDEVYKVLKEEFGIELHFDLNYQEDRPGVSDSAAELRRKVMELFIGSDNEVQNG